MGRARRQSWKGTALEVAEKLYEAGSTMGEQRFRSRQYRGRAALQRRVGRLESFGLQPGWTFFAQQDAFFPQPVQRCQ